MKERYYKYLDLFLLISASFALAAQVVFDKYISSNQFLMQIEWVALSVTFVSSLGVFFILFTLMKSAYELLFWRVFNRRYYIDGVWEAVVTKTQGEPEVLYGDVVIEQSYDKIHFSAQHYKDKSKKETWSHWDSTNVFITDGNIDVYWKVTRMNGEIITGHITFKADGNKPPKELSGIFVDNIPSNSLGHMHYIKKCHHK